MHGEIKLESDIGQGTKTTFWIPFHKAYVEAGDFPLVDLGPFRWPVSGDSSVRESANGDISRDHLPESLGHAPLLSKRMTVSDSNMPPQLTQVMRKPTEGESSPLDIDRRSVHILVVEDK